MCNSAMNENYKLLSFSVIFNVFCILIVVIIVFAFVLNLKTFWSLWSASANYLTSSIVSYSPCVSWHESCVCPVCMKFPPLPGISHLLQLSFPVF